MSLRIILSSQNQQQWFARCSQRASARGGTSVLTGTFEPIEPSFASTGFEACAKKAISANSSTSSTWPKCPNATFTPGSVSLLMSSVLPYNLSPTLGILWSIWKLAGFRPKSLGNASHSSWRMRLRPLKVFIEHDQFEWINQRNQYLQ